MGAETMLWASDATWGAETIRCLGEGPASRWVKDLHCSSVPAMMDVVMDVGTTYIASFGVEPAQGPRLAADRIRHHPPNDIRW